MIVCAGYIGLEIGIALAKLGSKVSLVEAESGILPTLDRRCWLNGDRFSSRFRQNRWGRGCWRRVRWAWRVRCLVC